MSFKSVDEKREDEIKIVSLMISLYCRGNHGTKGAGPCPECAALTQYAADRSNHCPHMATKTFCSNCPTHCYKPEMREKIKAVMKYSGLRMMASVPNLTNAQMIAGSLLGFFGIFLEGLAYFAIYRLMADSAPKYAHIFRTGIFGYIWLGPVGCHLNMGILNMAYKYLLQADSVIAAEAAKPLIYGFSIPVYILLVFFWVPMIIVQFKAFAKGLTPYPKSAKWFCMIIGMIPPLIVSALIGPSTALGAGIGTMFISFGNALVFGGLLAVLPSEERFEEFRKNLNA